MVKKNEIDFTVRISIKILKNEGYSSRDIRQKLNIPYSTVNYTLRKFKVTWNLENIQRSGRAGETTSRIDRKIVNLIELSNEPNATDVEERLSE